MSLRGSDNKSLEQSIRTLRFLSLWDRAEQIERIRKRLCPSWFPHGVGARAKENGATDIDCEWVRTLFDDACFENSKPLGPCDQLRSKDILLLGMRTARMARNPVVALRIAVFTPRGQKPCGSAIPDHAASSPVNGACSRERSVPLSIEL